MFMWNHQVSRSKGPVRLFAADSSNQAPLSKKYRQWHRHHYSRSLPHPKSPKNVIGSARIKNVVLGSPGEQLLHLLHTSYATFAPGPYWGLRPKIPVISYQSRPTDDGCVCSLTASAIFRRSWHIDSKFLALFRSANTSKLSASGKKPL